MSKQYPTTTNTEGFRTNRPRKPQQRWKMAGPKRTDHTKGFNDLAQMIRERDQLAKQWGVEND